MHMYVWLCEHICTTCMYVPTQVRVLKTMDLELKEVVSCVVWELGNYPESSARRVSVLYHLTVSPALKSFPERPSIHFLFVQMLSNDSVRGVFAMQV